ncbi:hypothetical protein O9993_13765 [Vibrio lentus]|nr:hypothetical protein [Vibrio lentus]
MESTRATSQSSSSSYRFKVSKTTTQRIVEVNRIFLAATLDIVYVVVTLTDMVLNSLDKWNN